MQAYYFESFVQLFRKAREQLEVQEDGTYGEITTVREKFGREPALQPEIEKLLKLFIEHCTHIGVPRSRGKCALDIQQMVIQERIPVRTFVYNKPGTYVCISVNYFVSLCIVMWMCCMH